MSARVKIDLLSQAVKQMVRKVMPNMESVDNQSFSDSKITFLDDSGALRLTVASENLYCIRSDDNYVDILYSDNKGLLRKYLLRSRLKSVEETCAGTSLVRCHRQFIVNLLKVKILRCSDAGYELELDNKELPPIPVSKTYAKSIAEKFR